MKIVEKNVFYFVDNGIGIYIVDSEKNGGYSRGNNLGADVASVVFPQTEYYIFSNNDLFFESNFDLKEIKSLFSNNDRIGIIGPEIISDNGQRQSPRKNQSFFIQLFIREWNLYLFKSKLINLITDIDFEITNGYTDWVSGCFMIVRRKAFENCGGFDENVFLYCEEMILSDRFRKNGYDTYFDSRFTLIHQHKGSTSMNGLNENFKSKIYYFRNYRKISKFLCNLAIINRKATIGIYMLIKKIMKKTYK